MQLIMNIPFTALHFATYESSKKLLALEEDESLAVQLTAGGLAGGLSAGLTTPLDVLKTRLQLEGVNSATRYGTSAVVRPGTTLSSAATVFSTEHCNSCSQPASQTSGKPKTAGVDCIFLCNHCCRTNFLCNHCCRTSRIAELCLLHHNAH